MRVCVCVHVAIQLCVIINNLMYCSSGESGAGKTESCKLMIAQLVELSQGKTTLEQSIIMVCLCVRLCVHVSVSMYLYVLYALI